MLKRSIGLLAVVALGFVNASAQNKDRVLVVMTRNLDAGSDFGYVTSATTPLGLIIGVTETYQEVVQSNIPERAQGIAAEIQARQPDLVALQEVTTLRIGPFGGPATTVVADQLQSLTAAQELSSSAAPPASKVHSRDRSLFDVPGCHRTAA